MTNSNLQTRAIEGMCKTLGIPFIHGEGKSAVRVERGEGFFAAEAPEDLRGKLLEMAIEKLKVLSFALGQDLLQETPEQIKGQIDPLLKDHPILVDGSLSIRAYNLQGDSVLFLSYSETLRKWITTGFSLDRSKKPFRVKKVDQNYPDIDAPSLPQAWKVSEYYSLELGDNEESNTVALTRSYVCHGEKEYGAIPRLFGVEITTHHDQNGNLKEDEAIIISLTKLEFTLEDRQPPADVTLLCRVRKSDVSQSLVVDSTWGQPKLIGGGQKDLKYIKQTTGFNIDVGGMNLIIDYDGNKAGVPKKTSIEIVSSLEPLDKLLETILERMYEFRLSKIISP